MPTPPVIRIHPEVQAALADAGAVVALESTIISHGLPRPENLRVAREVEQVIRDQGAVPATVAIVDGTVLIGLDEDALDRVANDESVVKASLRDLAWVCAQGMSAATTVAATSHIAQLVGIEVFATGGLGGIHRGARETWDESADLTALGTIPITVVCSGVKSILDVPATLERLETLNVAVTGYGTSEFPGFYLSTTGQPLTARADSPEQVAEVITTRRALNVPSALVVANPLPESEQVDPDLHERVLAEGMALAERRRVVGKDVTPFLLDYFHRATDGVSLLANERIILRNADLAARIAVAVSGNARQHVPDLLTLTDIAKNFS